jgi:plasmid maintenance system killer protein
MCIKAFQKLKSAIFGHLQALVCCRYDMISRVSDSLHDTYIHQNYDSCRSININQIRRLIMKFLKTWQQTTANTADKHIEIATNSKNCV